MIDKLKIIYQRLPTIKCKGKCTHSCGPLLMSAFEKNTIIEKIGPDPFITMDELAEQLKNNDTNGLTCPLLKNGKCSIYSIRPLICRLYGLVKRMKCPHGCKPSRWLTDKEARFFLNSANDL